MIQKNWSVVLFTLLWALLVAVAIYTRPALPVDETRYLAVAWEMWLRGDFIVPHLNGETYSHKPPLLFWLMNVGWAIFGVNDWWPPLVAPLFALACLFLTRAMARRLWPEQPLIADLAPFVLLGAVFWTIFTTVTMFDMLVATCTLSGLLGLLMVWREGGQKGWWILAIAIGFGVLAKGPVILLQILPIALLAPFWDREGLIKARFGSWKGWYARIFLSVLGGAVIGLAWAVPAGILGGEEYRNAIFWGQTAGRVVKAFDHARPWWWYLAVIGPLLLPWLIWPTLWKAVKQAGSSLWSEAPLRFCILWFVPIFFAFSLISGKQLHYLLPIFPAFAFFLTRLLLKLDIKVTRLSYVLPGVFFILLGTVVLIAPYLGIKKMPEWAFTLPTYWMALPILGGLFLIVKSYSDVSRAIVSLCSTTILLVIAIHLVMAPHLTHSFDLHRVSQKIHGWQQEGYEVAFVGKYHGTFQFLGRLEHPITELATERGISIADWVKEHPKAKVLTMWKQDAPDHPAVDMVDEFRGNTLIGFDLKRLNGDFEMLNRRGKVSED